MGQLINKDYLTSGAAIALDISWYLEDAYYSWDSRRWAYTWPSKSLPYSCAIHRDDFKRHLKPAIRVWVEKNIYSAVIYEEISKNYRYYYDSEDRSWDRSYEISNVWVVFYFTDADDALMFKLKFSDYVREITELHPKEDHDYEKTSYYKTY